MKIALTGAHGTGKSTLAKFLKEEISKKGQNVVVTPEVPRLICEAVNDKEYFRRGNNSLLKQSLILLGQLVIENEIDEEVHIQICDRTLFDHWAYSLSLFKEEIEEGNFSTIYEKFIAQHCQSYDKIFYLPIEFKPIDDGIRESDEKFQREIDELIVDLLTKHNIEYTTLTGSVEKRGENLLKNINI